MLRVNQLIGFGRRAAAGGGGGPSDPFFANVLFLSGFEGTNGSTSPFADETGVWTITPSGGASLSSTRAEYGATSGFVSNTAGAFTTGTSANWNLSTANSDPFTWEFSINYTNAIQTYDVQTIDTSGGSINTWMRVNSDGNVRYLGSKTGSGFPVDITTTSGGITATNTWYKVCVEKNSSGVVRIYVGGVMKVKSTPADSILFGNSGLRLRVNSGNNTPQSVYQDNVRITKGIARYDSDAGYTPATAAFPTH